MCQSPRRAKSALAGSIIAERRIENERMSDDLQSRINALQMKQYRLRADRDFEIKQAKEEAQVVFDQAKIVQTKSLAKESLMPKGWRVIEPPKNLNTKNKRIIKERPPAAVFDPDDPRTYSTLAGEDGKAPPRPKTSGQRRPKTPRRPRPKTALATSVVPPMENGVGEYDQNIVNEQETEEAIAIEHAIVIMAKVNIPDPKPFHPVAIEIEEPLRFSNFLGFIRPKTADSNRRPRGGFGDPNSDYKHEKGKGAHHLLSSQMPPQLRPQTAGNPQRPKTARSASRPQSRAEESQGGQSYKDLKSQNHIDFASIAMKHNKKSDSVKKREAMHAKESARLQVRMEAFYDSIDDFKIKAAHMKKQQLF